MFTPGHIKEGKMLLKGVTKFIHYKRDVLSEEKLVDQVEVHRRDYETPKLANPQQQRGEKRLPGTGQ